MSDTDAKARVQRAAKALRRACDGHRDSTYEIDEAGREFRDAWHAYTAASDAGYALELVKAYIADYKAMHAQARVLAKEYGAERYWLGNNGVYALDIDHPEFKKRDRKGLACPKRKTPAAERFAQQEPTAFPFGDVAKHLGIPHHIEYSRPSDGSHGSRAVARHRFCTAGVLFLSEAGPYAIYAPDIREQVAQLEAEGYVVDKAAKDWRPLIPGCRLIPQEQWKLYVARHEYDEAMAKVAATEKEKQA